MTQLSPQSNSPDDNNISIKEDNLLIITGYTNPPEDNLVEETEFSRDSTEELSPDMTPSEGTSPIVDSSKITEVKPVYSSRLSGTRLPPPSSSLSRTPLSPKIPPPIPSDHSESLLRQKWHKLSLQNKAILASFLIGLVPVALVGIGTFLGVRNAVNQQVSNNLKLEMKSQVKSLDSFLQDRIANLSLLAGREIFSHGQVRNNFSPQDKANVLAKYRQDYAYFSQISFIDSNGNLVASSGGEDLSNQKNAAFFKQIQKTKKPVINLISAGSDGYNLEIVTPVIDPQTQAFLGVILGKISTLELNKQLGYDSQDSESNSYHLVDQNNVIIASNHREDIGKNLAEEFPLLAAQQQRQGKADFLKVEEKHGDTRSLVGFRPANLLPESANLDWNLVLVRPADQVYAAAHPLLRNLILGTIATSALILTAALLAAKPLTRPIRRLAQAVEKMGEGNFEVELEHLGEDELGILGKNINSMGRQLKNLLQEQSLSLEQSKLLADIANRLNLEQETLDSLFQDTLGQIRRLLKLDRVVVYRFQGNLGGSVVYESLSPGWPSALGETFNDPCIPASLLEQYKAGRVVVTHDVSEEVLHPEHLYLTERLQIRSRVIVPLLKDGSLFGLLIAHHCGDPYHWPEAEVNFLKKMAEQLSLSLDRLSFQQQRREDAKRAGYLKDITLSIAAALNTTEVFDVAVEEVRRAMATDRVIVYRFNADWSGIIIAESVLPQFPQALGANIADPCFADKYVEKYRQGRIQGTPDIYEAGLTPCHLKQLEPFKVRANLVAPIIEDGQLLGLLIAHHCAEPRIWTQGEMDFFGQVATQVGLALERTDLLEKQRKAEEEQRKARQDLQKRALDLLMEVDPVSRGDLTIRAHVTEDEIGTIADSYNATIESLRRIVTQVQAAVGQLSDTTGNNEVAIRSLSEEAMNQATDIAQALDRIQQMTHAIQEVAVNAEQAEAAVQQATHTVETGEEAMNRTVDGIMAIRETVAETAKKVKRLGESSQKISKVVNLIGSFADQTNLLALNASIEAAHAGEEGRGFAVVADEVRSLARQSAEATAEIEALVASIQAETNDVVAAMEAGTEQVVMGTKLVDETRKSLNQITAASIQISELVAAIAQTAVQQADTSQTVTQTMAQVAAISNKTSAEAAQVSESFRQLLEVAQTLQESVRQFRV